ncbi:uncharacterized protein LOC133205342 [Saccostrea echinata]|uniref:uncharacterized protein LOC133205342 n=1 Tax=Saccostrea echinata TaxID=191078 RepID=UPI002A8130CD|nr:uncharacterized protein LOC133205342 [Saccostrea echinata]
MKFLYIYWLSVTSICLGCYQVADVIFVLDGSDSLSTTDFLHEVSFVASEPAQYHVLSGHVRFGAILYGSQVTNKISIVPSIENNQFVNKVTKLRQTGGKPLLFRALTELRKEFSNNYRHGSRRVAIVIISDRVHNKNVVLREIRYLRSAGVITIPIGVGPDTQEGDLRDLLTFQNPIYQINNFSEIYQLSKVIYNTVCTVKTTLSETTSFPLPESHSNVGANIEKENFKNSTVSAKQLSKAKRLKNEIRRTPNLSLSGLQIEVPELREMVDKRPSMRPYFINYSLLGTKESKMKNKESKHDSAKSFHKTGKKVTGIIIKNEIWASSSTPATKTIAREKSWTTKISDKAVDRKPSLEWMAKGLDDFKMFLKKLENPKQKNTGGSQFNLLYTTKKKTDVDVKIPSQSKTTKKQRTDTTKVKNFVITHYNNSFSVGNPTRNPTTGKHRSSSRTVFGTKPQDGTKRKPYRVQQPTHPRKVNINLSRKQQTSLRRHKDVNYKTQKPYTQTYRKLPIRNRVGIPVVNTISKLSGNSISSEKTVSEKVQAKIPKLTSQISKDRSMFTDSSVLGSHLRPIFTLSGSIENNVFSGGNSLQVSSTDGKQNRGQLSKNGLSQNRIVHERPQITSNLYSPSNEFYIENGVNSISYKQHFKKLFNPDAKSDDSVKAPYTFDGSKIYATGTTGPLFLSHEKNYHQPETQFPTTPVPKSRDNKRPFYLTGPNQGHLTPSIVESSTQPSMFNTEKLTTRQSNTFPPNFLELLGISLKGTKKQAANLKSSPFSSLPQKPEKYHQQDINVHFYRQSPYLPSPWGEPTGAPQDLPLRPFRQIPGDIGLSFSDQSCTKNAHPSDPKFYIERLTFGSEIRPCPPGTIFDLETCGCTKSFLVIKQFDCTPELQLTFDSDFSDISGKSTIAINRVQLQNSSAVFHGDGELLIWRFSGGYIGNHLMTKLRFKPTKFQEQRQLLVGNCAKGSAMSYGVEIDTKSRELVVTIKTVKQSVTIKMHFKMFHWNDLVMIYDGSEFKAILNGKKEVIPLTGVVEERLNPLNIGRCDQTKLGFQGYIDNVELSFCVPEIWKSL